MIDQGKGATEFSLCHPRVTTGGSRLRNDAEGKKSERSRRVDQTRNELSTNKRSQRVARLRRRLFFDVLLSNEGTINIFLLLSLCRSMMVLLLLFSCRFSTIGEDCVTFSN